MAKEQHLTILKQGVETWNGWRKQCPQLQPDLSNADLTSAYLSDADLGYANLTSANLGSAALSSANLSHAILKRTTLSRADLSNADLSSANLSVADLTGANLTSAKLTNTQLSGAYLSGTYLTNARLSNTNLSGADLTSTKLSGADLSGANLSSANLSDAYLSRANLSHTNLSGADFSRANLAAANLSHADLSGAYLSNAYLHEVNLSAASLVGAYLRAANLSHANLSHANLSRANLSYANLSYANLSATIVLAADMNHVVFTGACVQDWQIDGNTNLASAICDFIYQQYNEATGKFSHRLPVDRHATFAAGDFTQHFQIPTSVLETVTLPFTEGIDWPTFFSAFQAVSQQHRQDAIAIQRLGTQGRTFVVGLSIPKEADAKAIKAEIVQRYQTQLPAAEATYKLELQLEQSEIDRYKQKSTDLVAVTQLLAASKPIGDGHGNLAVQNYCTDRGNLTNSFVRPGAPGSQANPAQDLAST